MVHTELFESGLGEARRKNRLSALHRRAAENFDAHHLFEASIVVMRMVRGADPMDWIFERHLDWIQKLRVRLNLLDALGCADVFLCNGVINQELPVMAASRHIVFESE